MGLRKNPIIRIVATLAAVLLIAIVAGQPVVAGNGGTTIKSPAADSSMDISAGECTPSIDCGTVPRQVALPAAKVQPASRIISANQSSVKYNTITDRADTLDRHPVMIDNPDSHNPTYEELMAFLKNDDTVKNKYDYPEYTCANFVVDLEHKAESKGIRCGYAGLNFKGKDTGHALNVFQTTDAGLVYVDLTCGKMIISKNLKAGMKYHNMGVIDSLKIYW